MAERLPPFQEMIDHAPDAMILVDGDGAISYANRYAAQVFGIEPEQLVGRCVETLLPPTLRSRHSTHRAAYVQRPRIRPMGDGDMELRAIRADGNDFPVDIHLSPIEAGETMWTLAVIRDATERHGFLDQLRSAKQAAERLARTKGEFLAFAAHDLCQPLQTLDLLVSAIQAELSKGTDLAKLAAQASEELARMRELLKMLIEISRLESGTIRLMEQPVSVAELFGDLERRFGPEASAKKLRFGVEAAEHVVETDPTLLRVMLSNLLANAIRYTPRGEVRMRCAAVADGSLQLAVSDTGIGIPIDQVDHIFEDFRRLESGQRINRGGFGLGLGIVRRLSGLLGYDVSVRSEPGRGSTFSVAVPAAKVYSTQPPRPGAQGAPS